MGTHIIRNGALTPLIMFLLIGTKFFVWGSGLTPIPMHCQRCGTTAPFLVKTGMTFITLFFLIPIFPVSGAKPILECPNCKARYDAKQLGA